MLRTDYPIYFDTTEITIRHRQWNRVYSNVLNINQTEDGHDDVEVIRLGKATIAAQFRCTDTWAATLAAFNDQPSIAVKYYDVVTKAYVTMNMRMDNLSVREIKGSDRLSATNGVYDVSFNLVEF